MYTADKICLGKILWSWFRWRELPQTVRCISRSQKTKCQISDDMRPLLTHPVKFWTDKWQPFEREHDTAELLFLWEYFSIQAAFQNLNITIKVYQCQRKERCISHNGHHWTCHPTPHSGEIPSSRIQARYPEWHVHRCQGMQYISVNARLLMWLRDKWWWS